MSMTGTDGHERFVKRLEEATRTTDPRERERLLAEEAPAFFSTPDVAACWEWVRQWDLSGSNTSMPVLIQGWLAFLCGDRLMLAHLAPWLVRETYPSDTPHEQSMRHALLALCGLKPDPEKRLAHAELAVAALPEHDSSAVGVAQNTTSGPSRDVMAVMVLANAKLTLAQVLAGMEQPRRAAALFEEAEALFREADMSFPASVALTNALLGHYRLGRYALVLDRAEKALSNAASFQGEVQAWWRVALLPAGMACLELLRPALAVRYLKDALACIREMKLLHMHGLVEWALFRTCWLQRDLEAMQLLAGQCVTMFAPMHHPFLDRMLSQFRLMLAHFSGLPLPQEDVEVLSLPGAATGASGMWMTEEMLAWLTMHGQPGLIQVPALAACLSAMRFSGNVPRQQCFLVLLAQIHLLRGEPEAALQCLREAVQIWKETGAAAAFVLYPMEAPHPDVALLRQIEPELHERLLSWLPDGAAASSPPAVAEWQSRAVPVESRDGAASSEPSVNGLTSREKEILQLAATGLANAEIAKHLFVGVSTVKWHINHIFSKLGAENRIQAIRIAQARGEIGR